MNTEEASTLQAWWFLDVSLPLIFSKIVLDLNIIYVFSFFLCYYHISGNKFKFKRTAHTPKCWIHLAKQDNLHIKPSNIINGGKGLFSWKKTILCASIISKYMGRQRTKKQIDQRYGDDVAKYALCNSRGRCVDANHTTDAAARFANDARNTPFQNNNGCPKKKYSGLIRNNF